MVLLHTPRVPKFGVCSLLFARLPAALFLYRFREKDFFYEEDWAALSASGDLSLQTAFSRSNPDGTGARVYVQRRIREQVFIYLINP